MKKTSKKTTKKSPLSLRRETLRRMEALEFVVGGLAAPCMGCTNDTWNR